MKIPVMVWDDAGISEHRRLDVNVSSDLSREQILQLIRTLNSYGVWDDGSSKLSLPKASVFEIMMKIL